MKILEHIIPHWKVLGVYIFVLVGFTGFLAVNTLPVETSDLFSGSGNCIQCLSSAEGVLQTDEGRDVSPVTGWRSTMMANSSKDPYWQASLPLANCC